ncbi:MAG: FkbM family methyltransferase [Victivallaceae bacterium]|jgi:FkbM family methyltransferase
MANIINLDWFNQISESKSTLEFILQIAEDQRRIQSDLPSLVKKGIYELKMAGMTIFLDGISATASLEVFQEIFLNKNHFLVDAFIPKKSEHIIDLGANLGFYALALRKYSPQCNIFCVEANPIIFPLLRENLKANGCQDIKCINKAVASTNNTIDFSYVPEAPSIGGKGVYSVPRKWMTPNRICSLKVPGITMDQINQLFNQPYIDIMKIDIEGAEIDVLSKKADIFDRTHNLVVERHSVSDRNRIIDIMNEFGFSFIYEEDPELTCYYADMYFSK